MNPLLLFFVRPSLMQSISRGCTSDDFLLNFAHIRFSFLFPSTKTPDVFCCFFFVRRVWEVRAKGT